MGGGQDRGEGKLIGTMRLVFSKVAVFVWLGGIFVSLLLPLAWAAQRCFGGPGRLPGALEMLAEKAIMIDAALQLPFGLTEIVAVKKNG